MLCHAKGHSIQTPKNCDLVLFCQISGEFHNSKVVFSPSEIWQNPFIRVNSGLCRMAPSCVKFCYVMFMSYYVITVVLLPYRGFDPHTV
jgi:hypothetical protein